MGKPQINASLVAPCGMNCAICIGHLRERNRCAGCRIDSDAKPAHCRNCSIVLCDSLKATESKFCYECEKFPCRRLKQLDNRYKTNYQMSMIENLESIKSVGIDDFVKNEEKRWTCKRCGSLICVHRTGCLNCGVSWIE